MSEFAPGQQMPDFAVTMRGYDRGQVEEYVSALQDFLAEAQRRATAAEAALAAQQRHDKDKDAKDNDDKDNDDKAEPTLSAAPAIDASAFDASTLDTSTVDASDDQEPVDPFRDLSGRVGDSVARILAEAEQTAGVLIAQAQHAAPRLLADAEGRLRQLTEQADREQARRDELRRQLTDLRDLLANATSRSASPLEASEEPAH